jgi:hypothetical protein
VERRKPLKRGGPLKRKSKLVTKKPLQARKALTSTSKLKSRPKELTTVQKTLKAAWLLAILPRGCEVCGRRGEECEGRLQAHHVVYEQHLSELDDKERWNPENGLCVCERAHRRHHSRHQPIERSLLRPENLAFAERHGLTRLVEKFYPPR